MYVKAPPEGLPQVEGMSAVAPHELLRIVKGAYGLAEAPRLWYLRAVELLEKMGMEELSFSRSTFVLKSKAGKVVAVCCMHVDDGFLAGEEGSEEYKALLNNIDKNFNIKEWKTLSEKPVSYLGMEVVYDRKNGKMTDDMTEYVKKIEEMQYEAKNEEKLSPEEVTKFRRLIMQMRWASTTCASRVHVRHQLFGSEGDNSSGSTRQEGERHAEDDEAKRRERRGKAALL